MIRKMICAALLAASLCAVSACNFESLGSSSYEGTVVVGFEPEYASQYDDFVNTYFNAGKDTVAAFPYLNYGRITHYATLDDDENPLGGYTLCRGVDTLATPDRKPSRYAVYDKYGNEGSWFYVVYHDTTASLMPAHAITIAAPSEESTYSPRAFFVQNVQATVQAALYGNGLSGGPFAMDDHLTITFTGYKNAVKTGEKSVTLIAGNQPLKEWTAVDLQSLGNVDTMDIHLTSSRSDMPLYCCLDDEIFKFHEIY